MNPDPSKPQGSEQPEDVKIDLKKFDPNIKYTLEDLKAAALTTPSADEEVERLTQEFVRMHNSSGHAESSFRLLIGEILQQHNAEREAEYHRGRSHELTEGDWVNRVETLQSELATAQKEWQATLTLLNAVRETKDQYWKEAIELRSQLQTAMEERDEFKTRFERVVGHYDMLQEKLTATNSRLEEANKLLSEALPHLLEEGFIDLSERIHSRLSATRETKAAGLYRAFQRASRETERKTNE